MALEQTFTTAHGLEVKSAYWRVYKIELNVLKSISSTAFVQIYKDNLARQNNLLALDTLEFDFSMDVSARGVDPVTQAYNSLKTQTKIKDDRGKSIIIDLNKAKDV
jgi:hypothetical protein